MSTVTQWIFTRFYGLAALYLAFLPLVALWLFCHKIRYWVSFAPISHIAAVSLALVVGVLKPGKLLSTLITTFNTIASQVKLFVQQYNAYSVQDILHLPGSVLLVLLTLAIDERMWYPKTNILLKLSSLPFLQKPFNNIALNVHRAWLKSC